MRILLIEDEVKTIRSLRQGLEEHQWSVDMAYDGDTGRRLALQNDYDVIVSDIIVPGVNGLELCRQLRRQGLKTPILLLSALGETDDKVSGLEAGADDYLTKPFEFREFMARVKALARRPAAVFQAEQVLRMADLELDQHTRLVRRAGKTINLTPREFALLEFLMRHPGKVLSKVEISEKVWDVDFDTGTNVVEVYVNYLRNKVDKGFDKRLIHTLFGQGYILKEEA
ncbi:MAG: response regulator transcription factor [Saprospiraceae bacterium]|nr:response regulator transcription factor [Saprospiraceae bacterium]